MSTIVIMPGGFHPFHAGHASLYNAARKAFPDAEVYVAATNDMSERPFPFGIKEKLAKLAGVEQGHFVQVKSPFQAREITQHFNPEQDVLIFVRSEKDKNESPKPGGTKKDGSPAYFQLLAGNENNLQPFGKHAYFAYLPTVKFGPGITSATEIRNAWPTLDTRRKTAMVMSLYPATQKNPQLAATVIKLLDAGMNGQVAEATTPTRDDDSMGYMKYFAKPKEPAKPQEKRFHSWDEYEQDKNPQKQPQPEIEETRIMDRDARINAYYVSTKGQRHKVAENIPYYLLDKLVPLLTKKYAITMNDIEVRPVDKNQYRRTNQPNLVEFAPDEGGGSRKFIPWTEFIEQLKQILHKDFDCVENVVKTTIKARFVPHDPMEYGPTMLYSYYETRAGRNKGAISTRGSIQIGKYTGGGFTGQIKDKLLTTFSLLKGHPFERHFDLTFDNIYAIANIIQGNTQGALEFKPEQQVNEFAPSDDGDNGQEDMFFKYAKLWYNGNEQVQQRIIDILDKAGWEIGEIESEEGGAFIVQAGDEDGGSYMGWSAQELEGLDETKVSKYKDLGATKDTTHFIKNVTTGEIVSPHRGKQDAEDALVAHYRGPRDGNEYKIVRARKDVAEGSTEDYIDEK